MKMISRRRTSLRWAALLIVLGGCEASRWSVPPSPSPGKAGEDQVRGEARPIDPREGRLLNRRADPGAGIGLEDASSLRRIWQVGTRGPVTHAPLFEAGRVHFADWSGAVYAVDARRGRVIWKRQVEKPRAGRPWSGFCGTGVIAGGVLFEASAEGNLFALRARTGELIWRKRFAEDPDAGSCGRLLHHQGLVYVPLSSPEEWMVERAGFQPDFRGSVKAYRAGVGALAWERRLVEPPQNGAAVWGGFALDSQLGLLYLATGNNYTGEPTDRSASVIAVDALSGEIRWSRQLLGDDVWTRVSPLEPDLDFAAGPQLFEAEVGGSPRLLVGAGQKSGWFWALDRRTGEVVWSAVVGRRGLGGGIHGEASIGEARIIAGANDGFPYRDPEAHPLGLKALDPGTGRVLWSRDRVQPAALAAGILAGDVYLQGSLDGRVRAYRASDGEPVWTSEENGPIASSLSVSGGILCFGTGLPAAFGGRECVPGVSAYATASAARSEAARAQR